MSLSIQGPPPTPPRPSLSITHRSAAPTASPPPELSSAAGAASIDPASSRPTSEGTPSKSKSWLGGLVDKAVDWVVDEGVGWVTEKVTSWLGKKTEPAATTSAPAQDVQAASRPTPDAVVTAPASSAAAATVDDAFAARVSELLQPNAEGLVHEEELYAALVYERMSTLVGREAGAAFLGALQAEMQAHARPDGVVDVEGATLSALRSLVDRGVLTAEQADRIHGEAFAAAQLDDHADALFDGRGSPGDPTIATARFDEALASARRRIAAFDAGTETAPARPLGEAAPTGGPARADGPAGMAGPQELGGGFLCKPRSDSDGNLVILLPPAYTDRVDGLRLVGPDGDVLAEGRYTSTANGGRPHFRFARPGGEFPGPLTVEARMSDGSVRTWSIDDPSHRHE